MTSETFSTPVHTESPGNDSGEGDPVAAGPATSVVIIEPSSTWVPLKLGDLWDYRELLYFLTWRDVKVRYKQTLLGAAWAILQPLLTMLVFTLLFGRLGGIQTGPIPYPLFAFGGLLIWTFFSNSVANSGNSLVGSSNLITKIYFPRMIIPTAAVGAGLVDFGLAFLIQIVLMAYYRVHLTWAILMTPVLLLVAALLAVGVGMWLSALNVKYRDIRYAIPFLIQIWMFASGVIYPVSMLPPKWQLLLRLNPLTGIIENFRVALFGNEAFQWTSLLISVAITLVVLVYSAFSFRRMERHFADVI
ncbi:MAG TPA: ABC transporter permease [Pyrinomonadaceae bacterium]|nr:ABC transporter permease [Pyrinomonadaceae bacterium]